MSESPVPLWFDKNVSLAIGYSVGLGHSMPLGASLLGGLWMLTFFVVLHFIWVGLKKAWSAI